MKVCILMGSPRKNGNTAFLTNVFEKMLVDAGHSTVHFFLHDLTIHPCVACRGCQENWSEAGCVQKDDMQMIFDVVSQCDALILATPIYSWYCTPPMKAALDRLVYGMNKYYGEKRGPSLWEGKRCYLITTCGYPPEKGADILEMGIKRYCNHSKLNYGGMLCVRHMGYHTEFATPENQKLAEEFAAKVCEDLKAED